MFSQQKNHHNQQHKQQPTTATTTTAASNKSIRQPIFHPSKKQQMYGGGQTQQNQQNTNQQNHDPLSIIPNYPNQQQPLYQQQQSSQSSQYLAHQTRWTPEQIQQASQPKRGGDIKGGNSTANQTRLVIQKMKDSYPSSLGDIKHQNKPLKHLTSISENYSDYIYNVVLVKAQEFINQTFPESKITLSNDEAIYDWVNLDNMSFTSQYVPTKSALIVQYDTFVNDDSRVGIRLQMLCKGETDVVPISINQQQ